VHRGGVGIDPAAVEAYEKHASDLVVYATALVGPSDAEDVVAEAMLGVFTKARWDRVREPRGYLFRCVLNQARMTERRRATGRRKEATLSVALVADGPATTDLGLLAPLSVQERAVIYLTYWVDLTPAAVGDLLDLSEGAVKRYLARARAKLRKGLTP
jgi:DNA-directed RNA polymerase specialized sigma24 family protein